MHWLALAISRGRGYASGMAIDGRTPQSRSGRGLRAFGMIALLAVPLTLVIALGRRPSRQDEARVADPRAARERESETPHFNGSVPAVTDAARANANTRVAPVDAALHEDPHARAERIVDAATPSCAIDRARCEQLLRDALDLDPLNARAAALLAQSLSARQSDAEAHTMARQCLVMDPTNTACAVVLVRSDMRQGHFELARSEVDVCLRLDPRAPECLVDLARLRLVGHDIEGATAMVRMIGDAAAPVDREVLVADIARARGRTEEARAHFRIACDLGQPYACAQLEDAGAPDSDARR